MKRIAALALVVAFAASIVSAQAATGDQIYAHPGRLVNVWPAKLNFDCTGSGTATVVFDAGWEDWPPSWATIQPTISRRTRTCTYDRAGSGFSEAGPMPRTSVEIAKELHAALHKKHMASEREHARTQAMLLSLSTDAKQVLVPDSGHYIQLDQPQIVIDAIVGELPKQGSSAP